MDKVSQFIFDLAELRGLSEKDIATRSGLSLEKIREIKRTSIVSGEDLEMLSSAVELNRIVLLSALNSDYPIYNLASYKKALSANAVFSILNIFLNNCIVTKDDEYYLTHTNGKIVSKLPFEEVKKAFVLLLKNGYVQTVSSHTNQNTILIDELSQLPENIIYQYLFGLNYQNEIGELIGHKFPKYLQSIINKSSTESKRKILNKAYEILLKQKDMLLKAIDKGYKFKKLDGFYIAECKIENSNKQIYFANFNYCYKADNLLNEIDKINEVYKDMSNIVENNLED